MGRVRHRLDINPWNAEVKGIAGWREGPFTLAGNLNFDFIVSGRKPAPAKFQGAIKATYRVQSGVTLGLESYFDFGDTHRFRLETRGDNYLFAVVDKKDRPVRFGSRSWAWLRKSRGSLGNKAILGVPIDPHQG